MPGRSTSSCRCVSKNIQASAASDVPDGGAAALAPPLAVRRLTLTNFRCYDSALLECEARSLVLTGPNGAGKTNLLESVSLLTPGRGMRRARIDALDRRPPGLDPDSAGLPWAVAAQLDTPSGPISIGTGRDRDSGAETSTRRTVRIDGFPQKSQAALADHVAVTWLVPSMDRLFQEGASGRRRFFDRLVYGLDSGHAGRVAAYEHAMRERSRLLKLGGGDQRWMDALEETMATKGIAIAAARVEMLHRLSAVIAETEGPFPKADIALEGGIESWLDGQPAVAVEDRLRQTLREGRSIDAAAASAQTGPHRTDLAVRHQAKNQPADACSTGEQKALLIAIVLADARLCTKIRGFPPLLLLDEIVAHLDSERRAALFDAIEAMQAQAWMTGTDRSLFSDLAGRAQFIDVDNAVISME